VIEDEPIVGRLCQRVLAASGFEVDLVNNGLIAREAAAANSYDFCVSDVRLPGTTGIELYEYWRSSGHPLAGRMIFITGDSLDASIQESLARSGAPCILKPFNPEDLSSAVLKALS
jgi:two-component system NtrC family sensor kinase